MVQLSIDSLAAAERAAFRQTWGMSGELKSWGELLAIAQSAIGSIEPSLDEDYSFLMSLPHSAPLLAAARLLDMASTLSQTTDEERNLTALLSAFAYAMNGNTPSAHALAERQNLVERCSRLQATVLTMACPRLIPQVRQTVSNYPLLADLLDDLANYFATGENYLATIIKERLISLMRENLDPFDVVVIGHAISAWSVVRKLSLVSSLNSSSVRFEPEYITSLLDNGRQVLLPPQYDAIVRQQFLAKSANALVILPTSSGKTLLGELALVASMGSEPGIAVYLAPYVALGAQVLRGLRTTLPSHYRLHGLLAGYVSEDPIDTGTSNIVVATPERFDYLLRNNAFLFTSIRCVVVDEAHMLEGGERGIRLEGLISRIRLAQLSGLTDARLILLSAVVAKDEELTAWLGDDCLVVKSDWRPTARRLAIWTQAGRLSRITADDPLRPEHETSATLVGHLPLPLPHSDMYPAELFAMQRSQWPKLYNNIAYLVDYLWRRENEPVLCVAGTRSHTRGIARAISQRFGRSDNIGECSLEAIATIRLRHPYLVGLADALECGVAYHNAGLPHEIREAIEKAALAQELKAICATTTLAEGIDLPFKYTVVSDWLLSAGNSMEPMSPLLFRNISGRSGRAGRHTSGETFLFDNPIGALQYTSPSVRFDHQLSVIATGAPQLRSALTAVMENRAPESSVAALESQILAAIPENPIQDDLPTAFAMCTLAWRQLSQKTVRATIEQTTDWILSDESGPLARAASPIQLTPKGSAFNSTGFSPRSCIRIVDTMSIIDLGSNAPHFVATILTQLADLPEQSNRRVSNKLTRGTGKFPVSGEDLPQLLHGWFNGIEPLQLFASLPYVTRSRRRDSFKAWLEGTHSESSWTDEFEKFTEFLTGPIATFLPWLLRAIYDLAAFIDAPVHQMDLIELAAMAERGVDSQFASKLIAEGAPVSRADANLMASLVGGEHLANNLDVRVLRTLLVIIEQTDLTTGMELSRFRNWLRSRVRRMERQVGRNGR